MLGESKADHGFRDSGIWQSKQIASLQHNPAEGTWLWFYHTPGIPLDDAIAVMHNQVIGSIIHRLGLNYEGNLQELAEQRENKSCFDFLA